MNNSGYSVVTTRSLTLDPRNIADLSSRVYIIYVQFTVQDKIQ